MVHSVFRRLEKKIGLIWVRSSQWLQCTRTSWTVKKSFIDEWTQHRSSSIADWQRVNGLLTRRERRFDDPLGALQKNKKEEITRERRHWSGAARSPTVDFQTSLNRKKTHFRLSDKQRSSFLVAWLIPSRQIDIVIEAVRVSTYLPLIAWRNGSKIEEKGNDLRFDESIFSLEFVDISPARARKNIFYCKPCDFFISSKWIDLFFRFQFLARLFLAANTFIKRSLSWVRGNWPPSHATEHQQTSQLNKKTAAHRCQWCLFISDSICRLERVATFFDKSRCLKSERRRYLPVNELHLFHLSETLTPANRPKIKRSDLTFSVVLALPTYKSIKIFFNEPL